MLHGETDSIKNSIIIEGDVLMGSGVYIYVRNRSFSNPNIFFLLNKAKNQRKAIKW